MKQYLANRAGSGLALLVVGLVLGGPACGGDRPLAVPTASTRPVASTVEGQRVDYAKASTPQVVGRGLVEVVTPDGKALVVSDENERFQEPGCEGLPEPVLVRLPLGGGEGEVLEPSPGEPLRGRLLRGPGGRVALVDGCEGFLTSISVAEEAPDGRLGRLTKVPIDGDALAPEFDPAGRYHRLVISPAGDLVAFNRFGDAPGFDIEALVVRFGVR